MQSRQVMIHRLQARTSAAAAGTDERVALRLRLGYLLGTADLHPAGMPPAGILLVRRMTDPAPGQLLADPHAVAADPRWAGALRGALTEHWRQAVRPVNGWVPSSAAAVWFVDTAQLTACLALGFLRPEVRQTWWWPAALRTLPGAAPALAPVLGHEPQQLPALLSYLQQWGAAAPVLRALAPGEALPLLLALGRAYELPAWGDWRVSAAATSPPQERHDPQAEHNPHEQPQPRAAELPPAATSVVPWADLAPEAVGAGDLPPAAEALLGVGLSLHRRPGAVRTTVFALRMRGWWVNRTTAGAADPLASAPPQQPAAARAAMQPYAAAAPAQAQLASALQTEAIPGERRQPLGASPGAPAAASPGAQPPAPVEPGPPVAPTHIAPAAPPVNPSPPAVTAAIQAEGVQTQAGGVLYLLNLMHHLDLPACYEDDWRLASEIGAWGTLELLGRALLGPDTADLAHDPLWAALALLDGRTPGTLPGTGYIGPDTFHVPATWQQTHTDPLPPSPLLVGLNPHLVRWLDGVLPYLYQRLDQALGGQPIAPLLRVAGHLYVTATHVDLVMELNAISLPVRLAGLDADPGWIRSCGRVVKLHYQ